MSLLDEARAETRVGGGTCAIATALDAMPPKVRAEWVDLLANPEAGHSAIARVAQKPEHGYTGMTKQSVMRHRNGDCKCPR